jgi:uncharacterized protein with FMN-binding domain
MKCVHACPRKNVGVAAAGGDVRPLAAGALAVAVMAGVYLGGDGIVSSAQAAEDTQLIELQATPGVSQVAVVSASSAPVQPSASSAGSAPSAAVTSGSAAASASAAATPQPTVTPQSVSIYNNGTYQGSGRGFRGVTTVSVTILNDKITSLKVVSHGDDKQFFQAAYPVVTKEILKAQSPNVDAVSGATYSSNGIMTAVTDALSKAKM